MTSTRIHSGRFYLVLFFMLSWLFLLTYLPTSSAQGLDEDTSNNLTLKAKANTVAIDIVVTGKDGHPVSGLSADAFRVWEDGHPQAITFFEEHTGRRADATIKPKLPPNVFTNVPNVPPTDALTVLLLDSLNTPLEDQARVHKEALKYLKNLEPGSRLAIFTLGLRLRYVQGFTDDPSLLREALTNVERGANLQSSPLLQSKTETGAQKQSLEAAAGLRGFMQEQQASKDNLRVGITLDAFQQLAHYLAGVSGRKNVVWFSGAFPMVLLPNSGLNDGNGMGMQVDYGDQVRLTDNALVTAKAAVYPVAASGLANNSLFDADTGSAGVHSAKDAQDMAVQSLQRDAARRNADQATMEEIARETGGRAVYNSNGLSDALARVVDHGSYFYSLHYTPTNRHFNGQYRRISVKLAAGNYRLDYRRGYYAVDEETANSIESVPRALTADPLQSDMRPGVPESTQIPIAIRIQPPTPVQPDRTTAEKSVAQAGENPKAPGARDGYMVDIVIAATGPEVKGGIQLKARSDGGRVGRVEAALVFYDQDGKALNWTVRQLDLDMDAARFAQVEESGVNLSLPLPTPKGAAALRVGVYDWNSGMVGTLEIQLTKVVKPVPAPALDQH